MKKFKIVKDAAVVGLGIGALTFCGGLITLGGVAMTAHIPFTGGMLTFISATSVGAATFAGISSANDATEKSEDKGVSYTNKKPR